MNTSVTSYAKEIFLQNPIEAHPLFDSLYKMNHAQVKETALQIYHVVLHFPRFLSAILTQIPDYKLRMPLVENLFEEHGRLKEKYVHSETYRIFLNALGITDQEIGESKPIIPVIAYNRAITDLCLHHPFEEGIGALGVIEEIVARVSPLIGKFALNKFSGEKESLFHFTSHETLDITHANEIYALAEQVATPMNSESIQRGLHLGMYYHSRLYTDILEHCNIT